VFNFTSEGLIKRLYLVWSATSAGTRMCSKTCEQILHYIDGQLIERRGGQIMRDLWGYGSSTIRRRYWKVGSHITESWNGART